MFRSALKISQQNLNKKHQSGHILAVNGPAFSPFRHQVRKFQAQKAVENFRASSLIKYNGGKHLMQTLDFKTTKVQISGGQPNFRLAWPCKYKKYGCFAPSIKML